MQWGTTRSTQKVRSACRYHRRLRRISLILRRFARALAGTQAAGDAYVAATLEVLIEDPSLFDSKIDPRVALFRTFTGLWNSVGVNLKPDIQTTAPTR